MAGAVLVINCGSSSIKYSLFDANASRTLADGIVERLGQAGSRHVHRSHAPGGDPEEIVQETPIPNHRTGVERIARRIEESSVEGGAIEIAAVGHRVAHGGSGFTGPAVIDDGVLARIAEFVHLAPLHMPANLTGIEITTALWPQALQVAVFDTAFHHTVPEHAYRYALPVDLADRHGVRRFGFHGTSHEHASKQAARMLGRPLSEVNVVVLHLGNGASACAVSGGRSLDTSMGMTPLEGLVMGTRSGDLDPGVVLQLAQADGLSVEEVERLLHRESGLKGLCGANDMRDIARRAAEGDGPAELALAVFSYRVRKYIGAYAAVLPVLDAVVFTGGIGENSAPVRDRACANLEHLGIRFDNAKNAAPNGEPRDISTDASLVKVLVIPANEELEIAQQTLRCLRDAP
ncbi:MAG: acetate kinase [Planctomycetota bacterium]